MKNRKEKPQVFQKPSSSHFINQFLFKAMKKKLTQQWLAQEKMKLYKTMKSIDFPFLMSSKIYFSLCWKFKDNTDKNVYN